MMDTDTNSNSMAEGAHAARRTRRIALACIGVFLMAMIAVALVMQRDVDLSDALQLRGGGALEFQGVSRGARLSSSHVGASTPRDLDGYAWHHSYAPPLTWREHLHRLSPPFVRNYLPVTWRARSAMTLTMPQERMLRFGVHGTVNDSSLHFTWEDSNGFESLGIDDSPIINRTYGICFSRSLPPSRSPDVILRVRERQEDKPLAEWPLLGEMRMKNPVLAPPSTTPVDTLPATRTVKDVSLTLQSIVVDPASAGVGLTLLQLTMPHENPKDWSADVTFYDERKSQAQTRSWRTARHSKGITLRSSGALWSDAPWHVRVRLHTNGSAPARVGTQAKFTSVPLPQHAPAGGFTKLELLGSIPVTLTKLEPDASSSDGRLTVQFTHPTLPPGHKFKIAAATDDLGRNYAWTGGSRTSRGHLDVTCEMSLSTPKEKEPPAKSLDVTVEIEEPLVFDFFVMPEFKKQPSAKPEN